MSTNDRHDLLRWPSPVQPEKGAPLHPFEMQDLIARGVLKGGLWLVVVIGSIALLLIVGNYGVSKFVKNWNEQPTISGY